MKECYENWLLHKKDVLSDLKVRDKKDCLWVEVNCCPTTVFVHFPDSIRWYNTHKSDLSVIKEEILNAYDKLYNDVQFYTHFNSPIIC